MKVEDFFLEGVKLITLDQFADERGFFIETYRKALLHEMGIEEEFVQDNHSSSKKHVLRGMHYQKGEKQSKLVRCLSGEIFDVAVDIRKTSKTYGQWVGVLLNEKKPQLFYVPKGFAHGFCVLSEQAHVVYKVSAYYDESLEKSFRYNDPFIQIKWPIEAPLLSLKDQKALLLKEPSKVN